MSMLPLPAPDAPASEWGRLAVSIPGFDWLPGMLNRKDGTRYMGSARWAWNDPYRHHAHGIADDDWPDPDDPATAGCLLALLGSEECWRLHLDDLGEWSFWSNGPPETHGTGHLNHVGESLGRACIAAAHALGRWPGGEQ